MRKAIGSTNGECGEMDGDNCRGPFQVLDAQRAAWGEHTRLMPLSPEIGIPLAIQTGRHQESSITSCKGLKGPGISKNVAIWRRRGVDKRLPPHAEPIKAIYRIGIAPGRVVLPWRVEHGLCFVLRNKVLK